MTYIIEITYSVDLPESHIGAAVSVIVDGICVSSALMGNNALAAGLVPSILGTPSANIKDVLAVAAIAGWALAGWAVSTT